jgi:transcriptional regulator with XRE-family HTH domain
MVQTQSEIAREVGRRIQRIRATTGVSARVLAECADMDLTNFQRIERGIGNPTIATLVQIATALEIDVAELVTGLDPNDLPHGHSSSRPSAPAWRQLSVTQRSLVSRPHRHISF